MSEREQVGLTACRSGGMSDWYYVGLAACNLRNTQASQSSTNTYGILLCAHVYVCVIVVRVYARVRVCYPHGSI